MIARKTKQAYYLSMAVPLKLSGWVYRTFGAPTSGIVKVHLGPGKRNYLDGWINVDANIFTAQIDVWADLRNKLPFRSDSVDVFYSHHVIEHLPDQLLPFHLKELFRRLKPGGCIRLGGPNGDSAAAKLVEGDTEWFSDLPDARESVGGRFANFLLCKGEHFTILTASYMNELLSHAGFTNITSCEPANGTDHGRLIDDALLRLEFETTPGYRIPSLSKRRSQRSRTSPLRCETPDGGSERALWSDCDY